MYFNSFLFRPVGWLVGWEANPTAFLFQKLGFAGVSIMVGKDAYPKSTEFIPKL
ncbi:MAG: hypothetical protein IKZ88_06560 [Neisseriaceae bacterium]|nr:hypothetical protein [Neisseriaceae bacterium]